eukprot:gb/GFBE01046466.1/.p1 GENE.gb/GFBE01046466.1/~~gb/GFBE01046466.1/.p1  ORF type:complete len:533 (+),score=80.38 gb/GFBE01046466.1/:1-1599(+)
MHLKNSLAREDPQSKQRRSMSRKWVLTLALLAVLSLACVLYNAVIFNGIGATLATGSNASSKPVAGKAQALRGELKRASQVDSFHFVETCSSNASNYGNCTSSAACPESHFCKPETGKCIPFCQSGAHERDAKNFQCGTCVEACPYVHLMNCSRTSFGESRARKPFNFTKAPRIRKKCDWYWILYNCNSCREACGGIHGGVRAWSDIPKAEDVFVTSYPKVGSTWVRHLLTNLYRAVEMPRTPNKSRPASFKDVDDFIPFIEGRAAWSFLNMFRDRAGPRIWKSHAPYHCDSYPCRGHTVGGQSSGQCMCPNCAIHFRRVIYIYRDGYNTLGSYFRFRKGLNQVQATTHFGKFVNDRRMYPGLSWADHIRSWKYAEASNNQIKVLWLRYETLKKTPEPEMQRVAKFLGLEASADQVKFAIQSSSFEYMEKMEKAEGGVHFFKKKYKKPGFDFVDSSAGGTNAGTPFLWTKDASQEQVKEWNLHNGFVQKCLGYPGSHPVDRSNSSSWGFYKPSVDVTPGMLKRAKPASKKEI